MQHQVRSLEGIGSGNGWTGMRRPRHIQRREHSAPFCQHQCRTQAIPTCDILHREAERGIPIGSADVPSGFRQIAGCIEEYSVAFVLRATIRIIGSYVAPHLGTGSTIARIAQRRFRGHITRR